MGSGGGTTAGSLPPGTRSGSAADPSRPNQGYQTGDDLYAPGAAQANAPGGPAETITGQQNQGGETQTRPGAAPQPGAASPALVPYQQVYPRYAAEAAGAMEREAIPLALRDYVREYFSELEP